MLNIFPQNEVNNKIWFFYNLFLFNTRNTASLSMAPQTASVFEDFATPGAEARLVRVAVFGFPVHVQTGRV